MVSNTPSLIIFSLIGILFSLRQYHKIKFTKEAFYALLPVLFVIDAVAFTISSASITWLSFSSLNVRE